MEKNADKICLNKTNKKEKNTRKDIWENLLMEIKENYELKRVEIDVVSNFTRDKVESFSGVDVGIDDDDEENRHIWFW